MSGLCEAWAAGLKSLVDHQQPEYSVVNFYQDFVDGKHSDFFQEHADRGLFYWSDHSEKLSCPN
jgi:hypothetical protein